jgi:hypothetical protein
MTEIKRIVAREWLFAVGLCLFMLTIYGVLFFIYGEPPRKDNSFFDSVINQPQANGPQNPYIEAVIKYEKGLISWDEFIALREKLK